MSEQQKTCYFNCFLHSPASLAASAPVLDYIRRWVYIYLKVGCFKTVCISWGCIWGCFSTVSLRNSLCAVLKKPLHHEWWNRMKTNEGDVQMKTPRLLIWGGSWMIPSDDALNGVAARYQYMSRYNSLFWRTLTLNRSVTRTALIPVSIASTLCTFWHTLTGGAGPVGHPGDESLLFAGRLSPVALVLVGVSVWAAHRDVVFVTLEIKHNQMLIKLQCDNGYEP